ncbi:MAG: translocation/assembly module TamB domain-containing protein, partial [Deltaproteobacteria bacterium]|nr:translocation/assembly module TamB domain-containing protein [Deltaproteobacteria bacterium]
VDEGRVVNLPMLHRQKEGPTVILESLNVSNGLVNTTIRRTAPWPIDVAIGNINIDVTGDENKLFELRTLAGSGEVNVGDVTRSLDRLDMRTTVDLRRGGLQAKIKFLDLEMLDVILSLENGRVDIDEEGWLSVGGEYDFASPLSIVTSLVDRAPILEGTLDCDGEASYAPGKFEVDTTCSGRSVVVGKATLGDVDVHLIGSKGSITIESASIRQAGGELRFSAGLALDSESLDVEFSGEADGLRFAELATNVGLEKSNAQFTVTGPINASGTLRPVAIKGDVDLSLTGFRVGMKDFREPGGAEIMRTGSGRVRSDIVVTEEAFTFKNASISSGSSLLRATAVIGFDKTLNITVDAKRFNARDVTNLARTNLKGNGTFHATIKGPMRSLKVNASLNMKGLSMAGLDFGNVKGKLAADVRKKVIELSDIKGVRNRTRYQVPKCSVTFRLPRKGGLLIEGNIIGEEVHLPDARAMLGLTDTFTRDAEGVFNGTASFTFSPGRKKGKGRLFLRAETIVTGLSLVGQPLGSGMYKGVWDNGRLEIQTLELTSDAGQISVRGTRVPGEDMDFDIRLTNVNSKRISVIDLEKAGLSFLADLDVHVGGTTELPVIHGGSLTFRETSYRDQVIEDSTIDINLGDRTLSLEGRIAGGTITLTSTTDTAGRWPTAVAIGIDDLVLERGPLRLDGVKEAEASISGKIEASLRLRGGFTASGKVRLQDASLRFPDYSVENDGTIKIHFTEKALTVDEAKFTGEGTRINLTGKLARAGPRLKIEGLADLGLLTRFIPKIKRAEGSIKPKVSIKGTWKRMDVTGEVNIDCDKLHIKGFPVKFSDVRGTASFNQGAMVIDIDGSAATGTFQVSGGIRTNGFKPIGYDVYADFNDVAFRILDDVPVGIEGRLALQGNVEKGDKPLLTGDVWLTRFRYKEEFKLASMEDIAVVKPTKAVKTYDAKKENVRLDIKLHGYENLRVANNLIDARFRIDETQQAFRLVGTDARPVLVGSVMVTRGTVVWQKKTFEITRGMIDFTSVSKTEPQFDIIAQGDVRDWRLTLQAVGTPEDFKVIVNSEPALSDEDIVCLLATDMTCEEAQEGLGFVQAYGLNELLGQFASIDQFSVVPVYDPDTGKAEPMVMLKQKLTDKFSISALSSLGVNPESGQSAYLKATIAYKVNENLSIEGSYDTKHAGEGSNVGNIGIDLSWRLEF